MRRFARVRRCAVVIVVVSLAIYACIATVTVVCLNLERRSRQESLDQLALAKPGVRLAEISDRLGPLMLECSETEDVLHWGTIKDRAFCNGKKLLRYYATTPPCRAIDVYTDPNGTIVHATWVGL
ncbi:MAG: hypothetical protein KBE65_02355 [Phycisphaerae bacterium]|nr:hypothetical protein [Phycisphaerae bacterium]